MKKLTFVFLLLFGVLVSAACTDEEEQPVYIQQAQSLVADYTIGDFPSFQTNRIFPELHTIGSVAPFGSGFYAYASTRESPEMMQLLFCNLEDGSIEVIEHTFLGEHIRQIVATPDGLILAVENTRTLPDEYAALDSFVLHNLSGNSPPVLLEGPADTSANKVVAATNGYIYVHALGLQEDFIFTYNTLGELLYEETFSDAIIWDIVFSDQEDVLFFAKAEGGGTNLYTLADGVQEVLLEMDNLHPTMHSSHTHSLYILLDGMVFGFDARSGTLVPVINLSRQGISGHLVSLFSHGDDYIAVSENMQNGDSSVFMLTPAEAFAGEVITLQLATMYAVVRDQYVEAAVARFNARNPQYFIEIVNYYQLYGENAMLRFNMDMLTGNAPDILLLVSPWSGINTHPFRAYMSAGVLADLAPFKERDLDINQLFSTALDSLYWGEESYFVAPSFHLQVLLGTEEAIALLEGKNFLEFLEFLRVDSLSDSPLFATELDPSAFVEYMVATNVDFFVDYRSGIANFDSEEFIALLQTAQSLKSTGGVPAEIRIAKGQQGFALETIRSLWCMEMMAIVFGGNFQITDFPRVKNGQHGVSMLPEYLFAVSAASPHTEAAWTFLRDLYQDDHAFVSIPSTPMNRNAFEKMSQNFVNMMRDISEKGGGGAEWWYFDEDGFEQIFRAPPIPLESLLALPNAFAEAIAQIDSVFFRDSAAVLILQEEVELFFQGDRNAEDTARILQSRVAIYLAEQN